MGLSNLSMCSVWIGYEAASNLTRRISWPRLRTATDDTVSIVSAKKILRSAGFFIHIVWLGDLN
jgi:hypothetical protein